MTTEKLTKVRDLLKQNNLQGYVIPSEDQHHSEYIDSTDARREFISGFTGSAGLAIITLDEALLFTDGRYFLQASNQLDNNWKLMKVGEPGVPTWQSYICSTTENSKRIGIDPRLISISDSENIKQLLKKSENKSVEIVYLDENLVDKVWESKQPKRTKNKIIKLDERFSGSSYEEKIDKIRTYLKNENCYGVAVSQLDEIAWLFNLRGSDIDFNPVFFAYAMITVENSYLYVNKEQLTEEIEKHLDKVEIKGYEEIFEQLSSIDAEKTIVVSPMCSVKIQTSCKAKTVVKPSYITYLKALKNETELEGMRKCHIRDGVALCKYFAWLQEAIKEEKVTEVDGVEKLLGFRKEQTHFVSESFDTISSTGENGAIIHYKPDPKNCKEINRDELYLCDSGGQYYDGTTDVTRTILLGDKAPKDFEKLAYTKVLQGMIDLTLAKFPKGVTGYKLDIIARKSLWEVGLDYMHGTGHGVGSFLNVHEGPQIISFRAGSDTVPLEPGMCVTNEPGYYEDGKFGIRIENVMIVNKTKLDKTFKNIEYYEFETVTMVPFESKLISREILTQKQINYINSYHSEVFQKLSGHVKDDKRCFEWLKQKTQEI